MFCKNCGAKQSDDAVFCHSCGERLKQEDSSQQGNVHNNVSTEEAAGNESSPTPEQQSNEDQTFHDLVNLYVGDKIGYYRTKWNKGNISWNWAGFFVSLFWLGYRRMYGTVFAIIGFYLLLDIVYLVFGIDFSSSSQIGMVVGVVIGMSGNQLYQEHVKRQVKKIKRQYGDKAPEVIKEKSGPSWGGFWISVLAIVGYVLIAVFLIYPEETEADKNAVEVDVIEEDEATEEEIKQEITTLIEDNVAALENKDIDGYMAMIYKNDDTADMYQETESTIKKTFDLYELAYEIDDIEFLSVEPEEVVVSYTQTTTLVSGDPFEDNRTTATHTIRKQDDDWKFYDTEIKDVEYLAESEDVEDDFGSDDSASGKDNAEEGDTVPADGAQKIYETNCAACHANDLSGSVGPDLKNVKENYSQEELEDIIRNGMGSMPPIGDHLSQEEMDALTEWLIGKD